MSNSQYSISIEQTIINEHWTLKIEWLLDIEQMNIYNGEKYEQDD